MSKARLDVYLAESGQFESRARARAAIEGGKVRVDGKTGQPARIGATNVILEAFRPGTEPKKGQVAVLDGSAGPGQTKSRTGSGVIY